MKVGDLLKVTIIDDNHLGNGIAKVNDKTIFVPGTLKDDIVQIKILKLKKDIVNAEVISFIEKSNHFDVKCPYYGKCGGCNLLHTSYDREKELKESYIKKLFGLKCKIISFNREHYRNKVTLHIQNGSLGLYEENTNTLVPIDNCLLLDENINELIAIVKDFDLSNIKEIIIKEGKEGLLISTNGSFNSDDLNTLKKYTKSIYQNNELIYGEEYLTISFDDINYSINHDSFFQINNECAKALYDKIKEEVGTCDTLLDLYCGTGSIGIYLNKNVKKITGIEINENSVKCAKKNIKNNNINNYEIIKTDASCVKGNYDIVIVDPPRSGLSKNVVSILNKMNMKKLIYVSCNPSTLKRDVSLLNSFHIKEASIFNMFPGTSHIETLMILEKEKFYED